MAETGAQVKRGQADSATISSAEIIERRQAKLQARKETVALADREDASPTEADEKAKRLAERRVKIAQILSQGVVSHALQVQDAKPDRRYVWVRDRPEDISRMKSLGYELETEAGSGMHGAGDNKRRVGDTILMSISRDEYEIIQEVVQEQKAKKVNSPVRSYLKQSKEAAARHEAAPPVDLLNEE